jgi:ribosome-associated toxin RatA of RatAB toxin-antitoxin module
VYTIDRAVVAAPIDRAFRVAADVERWPEFLRHYRWVTMHERRGAGGVVEMAAYRPFGVFNYPTWWTSEMEIRPDVHEVHYRHIAGITKGMEVVWKLEPHAGQVAVSIVHEWDGPRWPLISRMAADWVIGPVFVHGIASRTLAGVKRKAELDA